MKKHIISMFAVIIAVASVGFSEQKLGTGPDCFSPLYWFKLRFVNTTNCNFVSQFELELPSDPNQNGVVDFGELQLVLENKTVNQAPYGYPDTHNYVCALGYSYFDIESFLDFDGVYKFQPKWISTYRCCIKRPFI